MNGSESQIFQISPEHTLEKQ